MRTRPTKLERAAARVTRLQVMLRKAEEDKIALEGPTAAADRANSVQERLAKLSARVAELDQRELNRDKGIGSGNSYDFGEMLAMLRRFRIGM